MIRAESVHAHNITFRPEQQLKNKVKLFELKRVAKNKRLTKSTEAEISRLLDTYFEKDPYISALKFASLCGLSQATANRRIKALTDEGKLFRIGYRRSSLYVPAGSPFVKRDTAQTGSPE